jgi:hypothetical protein
MALLPTAVAAESCGDGARLYRQLDASIVRVEAREGANIFRPPRLGSGIVIADRLVVTADHVVAAAAEVLVIGAEAAMPPRSAGVRRRPTSRCCTCASLAPLRPSRSRPAIRRSLAGASSRSVASCAPGPASSAGW